MGLLKFLAIFALIYFGFRFIFRLVIPYFLGRFVRRAQQNFMDQMNQQQQRPPEDFREGEVTIEQTKPKSGPKKDFEGGEYVDFEEVKD